MDKLLDHSDINIQFINKVNTNLRKEAKMVSSISDISLGDHARTSCYFTALLIQWLVSDQEWIKVNDIPNEDIYQVVIGENELDDQHYLTVFNGNVVFQSFWKEYTLRKTFIPDLNTLLKSCDWFKLTNVVNPNCNNYKCFYYVPVHKYDETEFLSKLRSIT